MLTDEFHDRPTIIPSGKYADTPIAMLTVDDLRHVRREFNRVDVAVQGAAMAELTRRHRLARKRESRDVRLRSMRS